MKLAKNKIFILKLITTFTLVFIVNCYINKNTKELGIFLYFLIIIFSFRIGLNNIYNIIKFWIKFALLLFIVFIITGFFQSNFKFNNIFIGKLHLGLQTSLILLNTVFITEFFLITTSINDILSLNINVTYTKHLILLRTLMTQSLMKFKNINEIIKIIPEFQLKKESNYFKKIKCNFLEKITYLMTIILFIKEESEILGKLIDNRIENTYHNKYINNKKAENVKWYTITGFTTIVLVATMFIRIPSPAGGYFNFSDVAIIFTGLLLGKREAFISGSIGCMIADIIGGFAIFAPLTFLAKGLEGWVSGFGKNKNTFAIILFPLSGTILMILIYFIGEIFMPAIKIQGAILDLFPNIIQGLFGYIGGIFLYKVYRRV